MKTAKLSTLTEKTLLKFWVSDVESGETLAIVTACNLPEAISITANEYDLEAVKITQA